MMTREKALDTAIFVVANTLGALLVPVENVVERVRIAVDDLSYDLDDTVRGYRYKYRSQDHD